MKDELLHAPKVKAKVTFIPACEGGRQNPVNDEPTYRPHIVIGDPHLRSAIVGPDGVGTEDYLGVYFAGDGRLVEPGQEQEVVLALLYYSSIDYSAVVKGATFTVREGGRVVAFGQVTSDITREGFTQTD